MFSWKPGELNPEQENAVRFEGNAFLIACPGSGKTRTLTYKIAYELSRLQSKKARVIAITYTHRAADEIHERIERLGVDTSQLWIGTIHSFCLEWILKPYGIYHEDLRNGFRVINSHDSEVIIDELCAPYHHLRLSHYDCDFYFEADGYVKACRDDRKHPAIDDVLRQYFERLAAQRLIDFELMLFYAHQILENNEAIRTILSRIFSIVLVDEYQDTKAIQYGIIASILKAGNGLTRAFIVGDPNQSIFQSLGGYPIKREDFAEMAGLEFKHMELWENYRSSERIVGYFGEFNVYATRIESASDDKNYPSVISYNKTVHRDALHDELVRLIQFNIETKGIEAREICILAPWWISLASVTRRLVVSLPDYEFNGPGMVPFSRDIDNFWYKLARIFLTKPSPGMYSRRIRWAAEILKDLRDAGVHCPDETSRTFLRRCNSIECDETEGLVYLRAVYDMLMTALGVDMASVPTLREHHVSFFDSATARINRMTQEGAEFIGDLSTFQKVFDSRRGITVSTIHGIKGDEYDTVIAFALLEGMVPHFSDPDKRDSAMKLLYVIASRARKNLHLISEVGRGRGKFGVYLPTERLDGYMFSYDVIT